MTPHLDGTITLGNLLTLLTIGVSAALAWGKINTRIELAQSEILKLKEWISGHDDQLAENLKIFQELRIAVGKLTTLAEGSERRFAVLESRKD